MTNALRNLSTALVWVCMVLIGSSAQAQTMTFASDIAPIIYNNCTKCHNENGVANFMPLNSYAAVSSQGLNIMNAVISKTMPPWPPDTRYSRLLRERTLSPIQINKIADWVNNAMPRGDSTLEPRAPVFGTHTPALGRPDTVIAMAQSYTKAAGPDEYRIFVLSLNIRQDRDIAAIEFVPGNPHISHHAIIALDTTNQGKTLDARNPGYGYPSYGGGFNFSPTDLNWFTWVPGAMPTVFPTAVGKKLYKKTDLLLQMHYGPSATAQSDSSFIRIYYAQTPIRRYLKSTLMSPINITNGQFYIPANTVRTFQGRMLASQDMSLVDVTPHAHLICTSWKSFVVRAPGDTVKLVSIPKYDFHWQGTYTFPKFQRIPAGSAFHGEATYNNTASNPRNPSSPPRPVSWGEFTTDEMFLLGYSFVDYEPGDENISLDNNSIVSLPAASSHFDRLAVYPNPARDQVKIRFTLREASQVSATLFDMQGREVQNLLPTTSYPEGEQDLLFRLPTIAPGVYTIMATDGLGKISKRLVVQ